MKATIKNLPSVTLICIDCYNYGHAVDAIRKSLEQIKPYKAIFITDIEIELDSIEVVKIPTIKNKKEYSRFVLKNLVEYYHTTHCLLIQHDGYVLSGDAWEDDFLKYDYIGAPWLYPDGHNVGNGGFSLRSHRLQMLLSTDKFIKPTHPEDENIGRLYRDYLETQYSIDYAPQEVAEKFSFELNQPICNTFGFHGHFHNPYKPCVVIKRTGAMGDVIMAEPLMSYYHDKGYEIYLDTMPENMGIFFNHPYPIKHISEKHERLIPEKQINLDLSYEHFPKENVLKTYFKCAGLNLDVLYNYNRNSKLNVNRNADNWLFERYIVIHADNTNVAHRNANGINWREVEKFAKKIGYNIIQVGKNRTENIGIYFNTETKQMLMYLIAGADLVIGIDSGITQISVALGINTIILTGSVNLGLRYQSFENIEIIKNSCPSAEHEYCYHNTNGSTIGNKCIFDADLPPCTNFNEDQIIDSIWKFIKS